MKLLTPATRCAFCGADPPNKITEADREKYLRDDPNRFAGTYRCTRCHRINRMTAEAFQGAA